MTMTPRPDACRAGATALSHSAACGGGLYALTSTGGCASCTCRSAAVTFGRGALMSLPTPPNERLSLNGVPESGSHIQAGMLKAYAVGTTERNPVIPNVPTSKEAGLPEFQAAPWFALFTPKGTPQSVHDTLSDGVDKALDDPSVRKRLLDLGADIPPKAARGQQPLAVLVKSEIARWTPIMTAANVKGE